MSDLSENYDLARRLNRGRKFVSIEDIRFVERIRALAESWCKVWCTEYPDIPQFSGERMIEINGRDDP